MALTEKLLLLIDADPSKGIKGVKDFAGQTESNLKKADSASASTSSTLTKVGAAALGAGAGLLAFGLSAANSTVTLGKEVLKLQRYTGESAEEASKLVYASKMSGVAVDSLAGGLGKLSKAMESGNPAFDKLGVSVRDSEGKLRSLDQVLPELADRFHDMPNGPEKTAYALQLFGKSGADLLPFLNKGSAGIKELSDEAEKMGLVLSQDNVNSVAANIKAQRELGAAFEGIKVSIGNTMLPLLTGLEHAWAAIPGPIKDIIGPLVVFGGLGLTAAGGIGMLVGQASKLAPAITSAGESLALFAMLNPEIAILAALAAAIGGVVLATIAFGNQQRKDRPTIDSFTNALKEQGRAADEATAATIAGKLSTDGVSDAFLRSGVSAKTLADAIKNGKETLDTWSKAANGQPVSQEAWNKAMEDGTSSATQLMNAVREAAASGAISGDEAKKLAKTIGSMSDSYADANTTSSQSAEITDELAPKAKNLAEAEQAAADATANHADAAKQLNDMLHQILDPTVGAIDATNKLADAQKAEADANRDVFFAQLALTEAIKLHGPNSREAADASDKLSEAQDKLRDAQVGGLKAATDFETSLNTLAGQMRDDPTVYQQEIDKINAMQAAHQISSGTADYFKGRLADLATQAGLTVDSGGTLRVDADTSDAERKLSELQRHMIDVYNTTGSAGQRSIGGVSAYDSLDAFLRSLNPQGRASGGPLDPYGVYRLHDTANTEVAQIGGQTLLFTGSQGGRVDNLGSVPAASTVGGARGDTQVLFDLRGASFPGVSNPSDFLTSLITVARQNRGEIQRALGMN